MLMLEDKTKTFESALFPPKEGFAATKRYSFFMTGLEDFIIKNLLPEIKSKTIDGGKKAIIPLGEEIRNDLNRKLLIIFGNYIHNWSEMHLILSWIGLSSSFIYHGKYRNITNLSDFYLALRRSNDCVIFNKFYFDILTIYFNRQNS